MVIIEKHWISLRMLDVKVYRTDIKGDIFVKSDGKKISITTSK